MASSIFDPQRAYNKIKTRVEESNEYTLISTLEDLQKQYNDGIKKRFHRENLRIRVIKCNHEIGLTYAAFKDPKYKGCGECIKIQRQENRIQSAAEERRKVDEYRKKTGTSQNIDCEAEAGKIFENILNSTFEIIRVEDNCLADYMIRFKGSKEDLWLGIQIKSTEDVDSRDDYNFNIKKKDYKHCLVVCICLTLKTHVWTFGGSVLSDKSSIKINKSGVSYKYDPYKISIGDLENYFSEYIKDKNNIDNLRSSEELNTPVHEKHREELLFRRFKEKKLPEVPFQKCPIENAVYDCLIDGVKVQEKIGSLQKNIKCHYHLEKNSGKGGKRKYELGDNDIYVFFVKEIDKDKKVKDPKYFYVIPESIMFEYDCIEGNGKKGKIGIDFYLKKREAWYNRFLMDFDNVDENTRKIMKMINDIKAEKALNELNNVSEENEIIETNEIIEENKVIEENEVIEKKSKIKRLGKKYTENFLNQNMCVLKL